MSRQRGVSVTVPPSASQQKHFLALSQIKMIKSNMAQTSSTTTTPIPSGSYCLTNAETFYFEAQSSAAG